MKMLSHALRLAVTYTSSTLYSPNIWAPGIRVPGFKRVPGYRSQAWQHGNLSFPKSRLLGTLLYNFLQQTLFKMKMENAVSCLMPVA